MFVTAANFCGLEIFILDFLILIVLSQLLENITHDDACMEGESFLQKILVCEEKVAKDKIK